MGFLFRRRRSLESYGSSSSSVMSGESASVSMSVQSERSDFTDTSAASDFTGSTSGSASGRRQPQKPSKVENRYRQSILKVREKGEEDDEDDDDAYEAIAVQNLYADVMDDAGLLASPSVLVESASDVVRVAKAKKMPLPPPYQEEDDEEEEEEEDEMLLLVDGEGRQENEESYSEGEEERYSKNDDDDDDDHDHDGHDDDDDYSVRNDNSLLDEEEEVAAIRAAMYGRVAEYKENPKDKDEEEEEEVVTMDPAELRAALEELRLLIWRLEEPDRQMVMQQLQEFEEQQQEQQNQQREPATLTELQQANEEYARQMFRQELFEKQQRELREQVAAKRALARAASSLLELEGFVWKGETQETKHEIDSLNRQFPQQQVDQEEDAATLAAGCLPFGLFTSSKNVDKSAIPINDMPVEMVRETETVQVDSSADKRHVSFHEEPIIIESDGSEFEGSSKVSTSSRDGENKQRISGLMRRLFGQSKKDDAPKLPKKLPRAVPKPRNDDDLSTVSSLRSPVPQASDKTRKKDLINSKDRRNKDNQAPLFLTLEPEETMCKSRSLSLFKKKPKKTNRVVSMQLVPEMSDKATTGDRSVPLERKALQIPKQGVSPDQDPKMVEGNSFEVVASSKRSKGVNVIAPAPEVNTPLLEATESSWSLTDAIANSVAGLLGVETKQGGKEMCQNEDVKEVPNVDVDASEKGVSPVQKEAQQASESKVTFKVEMKSDEKPDLLKEIPVFPPGKPSQRKKMNKPAPVALPSTQPVTNHSSNKKKKGGFLSMRKNGKKSKKKSDIQSEASSIHIQGTKVHASAALTTVILDKAGETSKAKKRPTLQKSDDDSLEHVALVPVKQQQARAARWRKALIEKARTPSSDRSMASSQKSTQEAWNKSRLAVVAPKTETEVAIEEFDTRNAKSMSVWSSSCGKNEQVESLFAAATHKPRKSTQATKSSSVRNPPTFEKDASAAPSTEAKPVKPDRIPSYSSNSATGTAGTMGRTRSLNSAGSDTFGTAETDGTGLFTSLMDLFSGGNENFTGGGNTSDDESTIASSPSMGWNRSLQSIVENKSSPSSMLRDRSVDSDSSIESTPHMVREHSIDLGGRFAFDQYKNKSKKNGRSGKEDDSEMESVQVVVGKMAKAAEAAAEKKTRSGSASEKKVRSVEEAAALFSVGMPALKEEEKTKRVRKWIENKKKSEKEAEKQAEAKKAEAKKEEATGWSFW